MNVLSLISKNHKEWINVCKVFGVTDYPEDIVQEMYIKISKSKIVTELNYNGWNNFLHLSNSNTYRIVYILANKKQ